MNRVEEGEFQIEAFEQANVIVGGLFAVVALNFTLNAEYGMLSSSDNTVRRLLALNYLTLALSLVVNLTLFRFNLPMRWFGRYVQEQVFLFVVLGGALAGSGDHYRYPVGRDGLKPVVR